MYRGGRVWMWCGSLVNKVWSRSVSVGTPKRVAIHIFCATSTLTGLRSKEGPPWVWARKNNSNNKALRDKCKERSFFNLQITFTHATFKAYTPPLNFLNCRLWMKKKNTTTKKTLKLTNGKRRRKLEKDKLENKKKLIKQKSKQTEKNIHYIGSGFR